ncbi:hypothetical protein [Streptomyces sp. NPDC021020]|uniref:hypothetical protein n=1 Tax=Streptomyces sp. NPDC021020 TaxID=3365109 RepID=UPI0037A10FCF
MFRFTALRRWWHAARPRAVPAPRAPGLASVVPPVVTGPSGPLSQGPFNRRVLMLVDVVDQAHHRELAQQLLEERGWPVRRAAAEEQLATAAGDVVLVVEARLYGAERGAVQAAVRHVERLAASNKVGMWVQQAALVRQPHRNQPVYRIHRSPTYGSTRVQRLTSWWVRNGFPKLEGMLSVPGRAMSATAEAALATRTLGDERYSPGTHVIRVPLGGRGVTRFPDETARRHKTVEQSVLFGLAALALLVAGMAAYAAPPPWKALTLLPVFGLAGPLGSVIVPEPPAPLRRPRSRVWAYGLAGSVLISVTGFVVERLAPGPPRQQVVAVAVVVVGGLVGWGVWLALAHSWFSRNASWILPLSLAPAALVLPWFGHLMYTVYLDETFGIPAGSVPMEVGSDYVVALKPVLVAAAFALFFLSAAGWARHFHQLVVTPHLVWLFVPLLTVVYVGTALLVGLQQADSAANRTAAAARAGRDPAPYFGLHGRLMCVKPLAPDIPVWDGPVPTGHAVLTFGGDGDRLWAWDPDRARSFSVRMEDVAVTDPQGQGAACGR